MTDLMNKEELKLVDNEIIDLNDFNSIEIHGNKDLQEERSNKNSTVN